MIGLVTLVALAAGGAAAWRYHSTKAAWRASRPAEPRLDQAGTELRTRIQAADARAASYPPAIAALAELAQLYDANGYHAEAEQAYRGLLRFDPANARWPHLLGTLLAGYGRLDEAIPLFQQAIGLDPKYVPARLKLADSLLKHGQPDAAEAAYQGVLTLEPANGYAVVGLARIDLARERLTAARERLSRAAAADPGFFATQTLLASVYAQLGDDEAAANARARASAAGRFREAPDPWSDELTSYCYDVYRLQVAAATATSTGDNRAAIVLLRRTLNLAPDDARTLCQLGKALLAEGDSADARVPLERAVALAPNDSTGWVQLATCRLAGGDARAAEQTLLTGLSRCSDAGPLQAELAALLSRQRRPADAVPHFVEAVRLSPEKPEIARDFVATLFELGRIDEGEVALRAALERNPQFAPLLVLAARLEIRRQRSSTAAELIGRARKCGASPSDLVRLSSEYRSQFGCSP